MSKRNPISRFLTLSLIFLCLLPLFTPSISADEDTDDLEDIQQLMALDEQEEGISQPNDEIKDFDGKSEAEVLSKAQRIVLELNDDKAKRVIEENEYVFLLGYAPWCARSAELMPRFAEAANALKSLGSALLMAKIDAERYPKAASNLGIKGYPTLILFVNGSSQPYTGGFSADEIVIWVRKKTGSPVIRLNSVNEANELLKKHYMFAVGLFDKFEGSDYEEFFKAAKADNEIQFVETSSIDVAKVLFPDIKPTKLFFGLVKTEPEQYTVYEDTFDTGRLLQFLEDNKFPLVTTLTEFNSAKVYSSPNKRQVFVFADADNFKKILEPLQEFARKFKSKIMFIYVDIREENLAKPFLTLFGLEELDDIAIIAFDYKSSAKYLLESDPTPRNLEDFCTRLLDGSLPPYYKSQPLPDNKNTSILTVVGKTFDDSVLQSPKNVLLEVHTPWCINCETTSKQVEKLAKHFQGLENLVFARIDASTNEHPRLQVEDYPTLLFYPASNKSNPINLPTKSSSKELAALINKHLKSQEPSTKDEL